MSTPAQRLSELVLDVPDALDELVADMLELEFRSRPVSHDVEARLLDLVRDPKLPQLASAIEKQHESVHSSVSRLVTTVVALNAASGSARDDELAKMRERGAEAVRIGRDSIVAYLGARRAHGGEATQAIDIGRTLAALGARVGVATGRALVDLARPVGEVVDKASSLAREAGAGQLFADETTAELARTNFEFSRGPASAWEVTSEVQDRKLSTEHTPFVGRGSELEKLFAAYERSLDGSQAIVVSVTGPPGIGKSRLAREFLKRLENYQHALPPLTEPSAGMNSDAAAQPEVDYRIVRARCEAYGRSRALGTAADALIDLLRIPKGAGIEEVNRALAPQALVHDEGGLLASLLAGERLAEVDPHRARDILYLAMTELMLSVTADQPCVLVLEDLQWSDPESVAWFDHLLSRAHGHRLLLLVMARPMFWKDNPGRFSERDHVRIELRPIPRRATMEIARALIGCDKGDPKLNVIAKQAAGSPLFAEELARVIAAGRSASSVPTIEAAIQVSLDALDETGHDAIIKMSVFGLSAWDKGLAAVGLDSVGDSIDKLLESDLIVEQALSRFSGTRELWFKHALVRDVAYASASEAMRTELHAEVARWLAGVGEDAATIAEHYELGGQSQRAAGYWEVAARRALAANALTDAMKMADRALTFAEDERFAFSRATLLDEIFSRLDERAAERAEAIEAMAESAYDESCEVRTMGARARYDHARSAGSRRGATSCSTWPKSARPSSSMIDEQAQLPRDPRHTLRLRRRARDGGGSRLGGSSSWPMSQRRLSRRRSTPGRPSRWCDRPAASSRTALEARRNAARRGAGGRDSNSARRCSPSTSASPSPPSAPRTRRAAKSKPGIRMAEEIGSPRARCASAA